MRRREFIASLCGLTVARPITSRAEQRAKLPTIGLLAASAPTMEKRWADIFVQRLRELGWIEGRTVAIEYRWAEGHYERFSEFAEEFVRLKVDVVVTTGSASAAVKQATSTIPIVCPASGDPVGAGLVASLARPGGNVTGLSLENPDLASKRVELFREVVPQLRRLAIMATVEAVPALEANEAETAARRLGLDVIALDIRRAEDIATALGSLKDRADGLYVAGAPLLISYRVRINTLALTMRLPTIYNAREYVELGGLISYGPNFPEMYRRAADYVDKILRGAKPADLPVEQPTKFDMVVNLTTAKALGLTIAESFLARADEVIE